MQISFSTQASASSPVYGIKTSGGREGNLEKQDSKKEAGHDYLSISYKARNLQVNNGGSRINDIIESLMKQKENLRESKQNLIDRTLESGGQLDGIKEQLKSLDEQIHAIDDQISQHLLDERKKALGQDDEGTTNKIAAQNKSKTEQEVQAEKLENVISLAGTMDQVKTMSSIKRDLQGKARIMQMEISLDAQRSSSPSTLKQEQLERLNKGISELENRIGETTSDLMNKIKEESNESAQQVESEPALPDSERIHSVYSQTQQAAKQKDDEPQLDFIV